MSKVQVRQIPNYPEYFASKCGKIYRKFDAKQFTDRQGVEWKSEAGFKQITPWEDGKYLSCRLRDKFGNLKKQGVHRWVLLTYVSKPDDAEYACHKNGNPHDNRLDNLYWGTPKQNSEDMVRHGHASLGIKNGNAKMTDEKVEDLKKKYYEKRAVLTELAKEYDLDVSTVQDITSGKTWKHVAPEYTVKAKRHSDAVLQPGETMKPVSEWPGKFITNKGRVFTKRGKKLKVMTIQYNKPNLGPYVVFKREGKNIRVTLDELKWS